jgi:hypothetical protein
MRYVRHLPQRFKNGFREGTVARRVKRNKHSKAKAAKAKKAAAPSK